MDTQRLILFVILAFSLLMLWEAWQRENRPPPPPQAQAKDQAVPTPSAPAPKPAAAPATVPTAPGGVPGTAGQAASHEPIRVATDYVAAEIDPVGGDLVKLELLRYKDSIDPTKTFVLLGPEHRYTAQSGLIGQGLPTHKTAFTSRAGAYKLADGQDAVEVKLEAVTPEGVRVVKTLTFHRSSYVIDIAHEITNGTSAPLAAHAYFQLTRDGKAPADDKAMLYTFTGAAVYTDQDKFVKVSFEDVDKGKAPYPKTADNGWIAMVQHYFVSALLPPEKTEREYYTRRLAEQYYSAGVILPVPAIAPGGTGKTAVRLYAGPEEQEKLKAVAPGLELVVDYGWLTVIAVPLF